MRSYVSDARALGKRVFVGHPVVYQIAKRVFVWLRESLDRLVFATRHPRVPYVHYSRRMIDRIRADGYASQYGQDYYLWNEVFDRKESGFFVDIGGNDPTELSNSVFLERRGWNGVAFDPLKQMADRWSSQRRATFHCVAVSRDRSERRFVEIAASTGWEHTLSGFAEFVRPEDKLLYGFTEYVVPTSPILRYIGESQPLDLLMMDVEGAESEVIGGCELSKTRPNFVMIENVSELGGRESVRALMSGEGYDLVARIGSADDLFERREKVW